VGAVGRSPVVWMDSDSSPASKKASTYIAKKTAMRQPRRAASALAMFMPAAAAALLDDAATLQRASPSTVSRKICMEASFSPIPASNSSALSFYVPNTRIRRRIYLAKMPGCNQLAGLARFHSTPLQMFPTRLLCFGVYAYIRIHTYTHTCERSIYMKLELVFTRPCSCVINS
jgi:hypothetical protein